MAGHSAVIRTNSPQQTREAGRKLGESCSGGEVIALIGDLGSGKTQFAKGLAAGLGVNSPDSLTSPTFVIINEYPGRLTFYHIDAYRLKGPGDLEALGVDDFVASGGVTAIEWADLVSDWLPPETLTIRFALTGETQRELTVTWSRPATGELAVAAFAR